MLIEYYGHCAFRLRLASGTDLVIDPFRNPARRRWFKVKFPSITADIVLVTHPHFDHDNWGAIAGRPTIIRSPLLACLPDLKIVGIRGKHARHYGMEFGQEHTMFLIESEDLKILHFGDNNPSLNKEQLDLLQGIDVLMLPVDGSEHILDIGEVNLLIETISPRIVLPMHYYINGLTTKSSGLESLEPWLNTITGFRTIGEGHVSIDRGNLPQKPTPWIFARTELEI